MEGVLSLSSSNKNSRIGLVIVGLTALMLGFIFYVYIRGRMGLLDFGEPQYLKKGVAWGSIPTLLHAFGLTFLGASLGFSPKKSTIVILSICVSWELSQAILPSLGTFDVIDLCSIFFGCFLAYQGTVNFSLKLGSELPGKHLLICALAVFTSVATSENRNNSRTPPMDKGLSRPPRLPDIPIYMSYENLRKSYAVETPRPMQKVGKVASDGKLLFVSEINMGVHVFDNSDPSKPIPIHFINAPGNTDVTIKDDVLLADSFVDLLAIQISGQTSPILKKRLEGVFEWDPYQAITDPSVFFQSSELDSTRGVIIGFEKKNLSNLSNGGANEP
jgi:hypothetical protein